MQFTALVLAASSLIWQTYADTIASRLGISPAPHVFFWNDEASGPVGYAWVPAGREDVFVVREWTRENADNPYMLYVVAHELCHIYHDHTTTHADMPVDEMEVQADDCVKKLVTPKGWREIEAGLARINRLRLEAKQSGAVPSRQRGREVGRAGSADPQ
jgi:hypothetical protein